MDSITFFIFSILIILVFIGAIVFMLMKWKMKAKSKFPHAISKAYLLVSLPKESSLKTQGNYQQQNIQTNKNQIALAEGLFNSIGGLRAEHGMKAALAGRNDHVSFEIIMHRGLIMFYVATPHHLQKYVEQMILAQYPEANIEEVKAVNIFSPHGKIDGCYLRFTKEYIFPIKTYLKMDIDPLSAIVNGLSKISEGDSAAIQFVMRSAKKEWHRWGYKTARELQKGKGVNEAIGKSKRGFSIFKLMNFFSSAKTKKKDLEKDVNKQHLTPMAQEVIKGLEEKTSKAGLDVNIRLLVSASSLDKANLYLKNIAETFNQFNYYQYGNTFQTKKPGLSGLIKSYMYREYLDKERLVLNAEEMASMFHFPSPHIETPNIKWLLAKRMPAPVNTPREGLFLGENAFQGQKTKIHIKEPDRRRHMYFIGMTGTGKSTLMENLVIQDIQAGHGVCVIDPHGTAIENIIAAVPKERAEDVVLFDPSDTERPLGLNILEAKTPMEQDLATQEMIAIFYKLVTDPSMIGPMFEHNMRNAMLTLMSDTNSPGTIVDIPRMFTDTDFQKYKLKFVTDPLVKNFWEKEMAKTSDFHKSEMLGYLISKVGRFIENALVRNIIGQGKSSFDFRKIMDEKKVLLVNLCKGKIGEINSSLLGLILVSKLQMAALSRADVPEDQRDDFFLYIDEFQNFITNSISVILAEARKYKLNLILAHQYLGQLTGGAGVEGKAGTSSVKDAIFGNVGTMACFRIGVDDAEILAKQLSPGISPYDVMNIEKYNAYVRLLIDNQASKTFSMKCAPPIQGNFKMSMAIKELSRLKYGRPKKIVEDEIIKNMQLGKSATVPPPAMKQESKL